jgi:hypothetical protein
MLAAEHAGPLHPFFHHPAMQVMHFAKSALRFVQQLFHGPFPFLYD